jgi:amino acid adenylation domain-containing protein
MPTGLSTPCDLEHNAAIETELNTSILHSFYNNLDAKKDKLAISSQTSSVTYAEMCGLIQSYCVHFYNSGIQKGSIVGVYMQRSIESLASQLALYQLGAIYLPIDSNTPQMRTELIFTTVDISHILSVSTLPYPYKHHQQQIFVDTINSKKGPLYPITYNPELYIMLTSGTTGTPKPILCSHNGLYNRIKWYLQQYPYQQHETIAHKTRLSFIDSITEVLPALIAGAHVRILNDDDMLDPSTIVDHIKAHNITRITLVPLLLKKLITADKHHSLANLRQLVSSGELLPPTLIKKFLDKYPNVELLNLYGSSEVSGDVTFQSLTSTTNPALYDKIGKPITQVNIILLDENNTPAVIGEPGELCVAGRALACRYLNPSVNEQDFLDHPINGQMTRIYKTGDICTQDRDDNLEYLGRTDSQIKANGIRFNLLEIEAVLKEHPEIDDCVVVGNPINDKNRIIAYYTTCLPQLTDNTHKQSEEALQNSLKTITQEQISEFQKSKNPHKFITDMNQKNGKKHQVFLDWVRKQAFQQITEFTTLLSPLSLSISKSPTPCQVHVTGAEHKKLASNIAKFMKLDNISFVDTPPLNIMQGDATDKQVSKQVDKQLIIINHVVEHFSSAAQLEHFIHTLASPLTDSVIYFSHLANYDHLKHWAEQYLFHHHSTQQAKAEHSFKQLVTSEHLWLSPSYFHKLAQKYKQIVNIEVLPTKQNNPEFIDIVIHINQPISKPSHKENTAPLSTTACNLTLSTKNLYQHLSNNLPNHMLPMYCIPVSTLKQNENGKKDRNYYKTLKHIGTFTQIAPCQDQITYKLNKIWSSLFDLEHIPPELSLTHLGANSIDVVAMINSVNTQFSTNINLAWLQHNNTLTKQAQALRQQSPSQLNYQPIVSFNEAATDPLIMFHPALIGAEAYSNMANLLNKSHSFYAVDSYNLYHTPYTNLADLAGYYADEIAKQFKQTTLYLGGWSMGAILAYEVARLLKHHKKTVKAIFMIDPGSPSLDSQTDTKKMLENEIQFINNLPDYLKSTIENLPSTIAKKMVTNMTLEVKMLAEYQCQPHSVPLYIYHAAKATDDKFLSHTTDIKRVWEPYSEEITTINFAANHFTIMEHQNTKLICQHIETIIQPD